MDKKIQQDLIKKLYTNPLRAIERKKRNKTYVSAPMPAVAAAEAEEAVVVEKPNISELNISISKPIEEANNTNVDNLLTSIQNVHIENNEVVEPVEPVVEVAEPVVEVAEPVVEVVEPVVEVVEPIVSKRGTKRKRNNNNTRNVKKLKLELNTIQEEIKQIEYMFHMGKYTPLTRKQKKEKNVLRRSKLLAKTYKKNNVNNLATLFSEKIQMIEEKPLTRAEKAAITKKLNKLKEREEALKLIIEKRLRSGRL